LLYDNEDFQQALNKFSNASWVFHILTYIAVWIVRFFQWILQHVYNIMNKAYLGLSRQMEFHADAIAATVVAPQELINSLLRLDITEQSYHLVLHYYNEKIRLEAGTKNFYPQQALVMKNLASVQHLNLINGLPDVRLEDYLGQQNSKINYEDQWSSHPSLEDRITHLKTFAKGTFETSGQPVRSKIHNISHWEEKATADAFKQVYTQGVQEWISDDRFEQEYQAHQLSYQLPPMFNGYFDWYKPVFVPKEERIFENAQAYASKAPLFDKNLINKAHQHKTLENDLANLEQIKLGYYKVKSFDYEGQKYKAKQAKYIIPELKKKSKILKAELSYFDRHTFFYYWQAQPEVSARAAYLDSYNIYAELDEAFESLFLAHRSMMQHTEFIAQQLPYDTIEHAIKTLEPIEQKFRAAVQHLLELKTKGIIPNSEITVALENYLSKRWAYFLATHYDEAALEVLSRAMDYYPSLLDEIYFQSKKGWLEQIAKVA
ncbi:MAG: M48 family metalloprotease, partial [Bacteroidota bacterium]